MTIGRDPCDTTDFLGIGHYATMPGASEDLVSLKTFISRKHFVLKRVGFVVFIDF